MADKMRVKILENGTLKVITDPISMPNHQNATEFIRGIITLAGGDVDQERRTDVGHHHHHQHAEAEEEEVEEI